MKIIDGYNIQALANISGNIKFPENLQPYLYRIILVLFLHEL